MKKLIYLDNAATTLRKPPGVAEAAAQAILTAGNAARGAHGGYNIQCFHFRTLIHEIK